MVALAGIHLGAADDLAARVIILANSRNPASVRLAEFYAGARGVPPANIVALSLPEGESVTWRDFIDQVYQPLQDELYRRGWIEGTTSRLLDRWGRRRYAPGGHHISYLVVCRGVPLYIANDPAWLAEKPAGKLSPQFNRNDAAVDSELSLLAQSGYEITGFLSNPLFQNEHPGELEAGAVVKVSRLDGPSFESARQLVTSALEGEKRGVLGRYYIDLRGPHPDGDRWLESAGRQLAGLGFEGDVERTGATFDAAARFDAPVFYFGWYAANVDGPFLRPGFTFPAGAVALHIHSFSAQTLHSDAQGWAGPLVARGVAATVGNVAEPYLQLTHRPDLLVHALIAGRTFGDAAYYALPALSWQAIAIGDPLYRPFKVSLETQEHPVTPLPSDLSAYAAIRRANLQVALQQPAVARAVLEVEQKRQPGFAVGLALAKLALTGNDSVGAVRALGFGLSATHFDPAEWPLARESAGLLTGLGARHQALQMYATLVRSDAPTPAAHKAVLTEARVAAEAAGEGGLAREFAEQIEALAPPVAK